jgi:hypothetical protein
MFLVCVSDQVKRLSRPCKTPVRRGELQQSIGVQGQVKGRRRRAGSGDYGRFYEKGAAVKS